MSEIDWNSILHECLSLDAHRRAPAEKNVKEFLKHPEAAMQLLYVAASGMGSADVRQLAAIMLRKRMSGVWKKIPEGDRHAAQDVLLRALVSEPSHPVRRALINLIGVIAKYAVPRGEWPGLLEHLAALSTSPTDGHREAAMTLFQVLAEDDGDSMVQHIAVLSSLLRAGLADSSPAVRVAAARCVAALATCTFKGDSAAHLRDLVHGCIAAGREAAGAAVEEVVAAALDAVAEATTCSAPEIRGMVGEMVGFAMQTALAKNLEMSFRAQALQVVETFAAFKPKLLTKHGVVPDLAQAICALACEEVEGEAPGEDVPSAEEEGDASDDPLLVARDALSTLSAGLPAKTIAPPVMAFSRQACAAHMPERTRRAGVVVLASLAEGCGEMLRKKCSELLEVVLPMLRDPAPKVRADAALTLLAFSEFLQPQIVDHADDFVPAIFATLGDPSVAVVRRVCWALDTFTEHLGPDVEPFIPPLLDRMIALLQSGVPEHREPALSVIASVAASAEHKLHAFAERLLPELASFLSQAPPSDPLPPEVKARAIECAGLLFGCVPKETALFLAPALASTALAALTESSTELREFTFGFFGHLADAIGPAAAELLPRVVPVAAALCVEDDMEGEMPGKRGGDEEDEEGEEGGMQLDVRTGVTEEKCSAAHCIASLAKACGAAFMPFMADARKAAESCAKHAYPEVRGQGYLMMGALVHAVSEAFPAADNPKGCSNQVAEVAGKALSTLGSAFLVDNDRSSVASAIEAATDVLKIVPAKAFPKEVEEVLEGVTRVLSGEAVCQEDDSDSDAAQELDEDEASPEEELLSSVAEFLPAAAKSIGAPVFAPAFLQHHLPHLLSKTQPVNPASVRAIVLGALAEATEAMGAAMAPGAAHVVQAAVREMNGEEDDDECVRHAAFLAGVTVAACPGECAGAVPRLLEALEAVLARKKGRGRDAKAARDNALGAVCRIAASEAGQGLPLGVIVRGVVGALPLREDMDEAQPVYDFLTSAAARLASSVEASALELAPSVVGALAGVLTQDGVEEKVRRKVAQALTGLERAPKAWVDALGLLGEQEKVAVRSLLGLP